MSLYMAFQLPQSTNTCMFPTCCKRIAIPHPSPILYILIPKHFDIVSARFKHTRLNSKRLDSSYIATICVLAVSKDDIFPVATYG